MSRWLRAPSAPDLGLWITRALARPLAAFMGDRPGDLVAQVRGSDDSAHARGLSSMVRAVAWLFAAVLSLGLGVFAMAVEDIVAGRRSDVVGPVVWPPLALCLIVGILSALRAGLAWYINEERWRAAGRVLRWAVTPGNRDVLLAAVLILVGAMATKV